MNELDVCMIKTCNIIVCVAHPYIDATQGSNFMLHDTNYPIVCIGNT